MSRLFTGWERRWVHTGQSRGVLWAWGLCLEAHRLAGSQPTGTRRSSSWLIHSSLPQLYASQCHRAPPSLWLLLRVESSFCLSTGQGHLVTESKMCLVQFSRAQNLNSPGKGAGVCCQQRISSCFSPAPGSQREGWRRQGQWLTDVL